VRSDAARGCSSSSLADLNFGGSKHSAIAAAVGTSAAVAAYTGCLFGFSRTPDETLFEPFNWVITALIATWVVADDKSLARPHGSFDRGAFIFVLFPVYVAYYLIFTRGWRRGLLLMGGITLLFVLPRLAPWCVWLIEVVWWFLRSLIGQIERLALLIRWALSHVG
jgi:hypothetical protein